MPHALDNMTYTREPSDALERELINHCVCHKTSYQAARFLEEDHELKVLKSGAGFYLGAWDDRQGPVGRDSQYFPSKEAAQAALDNREWEQRMTP